MKEKMKKKKMEEEKERKAQQQQQQKEEGSARELLQILQDFQFTSAADAARAWATGQLSSRPGPLPGLSRVSPTPPPSLPPLYGLRP